MYQPSNAERPEYPVFSRVNGRILSFLPGKGALVVLAAAALSLVLVSGIGGIVREEEVPLSEYEALQELERLKAERASLRVEEVEARIAEAEAAACQGPSSEGDAEDDLVRLKGELSALEVTLGSLSSSELERLKAQALEDGVGSEDGDEELREKVPPTKREEIPVVDGMTCVALFGFAPIATALVLVVEPSGMPSIASCIASKLRYARKQHVYFYCRSADREEAGKWC